MRGTDGAEICGRLGAARPNAECAGGWGLPFAAAALGGLRARQDGQAVWSPRSLRSAQHPLRRAFPGVAVEGVRRRPARAGPGADWSTAVATGPRVWVLANGQRVAADEEAQPCSPVSLAAPPRAPPRREWSETRTKQSDPSHF